jgi:hypothetical protein
MAEKPVAQVFLLCAAYCIARGHTRINELPGTLDLDIDSEWSIRFNGQREAVDGIPPYRCLLSRNGWPAALAGPGGGELLNTAEDDVIAVLEAAIRREGGELPYEADNA